MSRIGKKPIPIPKNVTVQIQNSSVEIKGPAGTLKRSVPEELSLKLEKDQLFVLPKMEDMSLFSNLYGLTRTLISNAILGVVVPWKKDLEIQGVGFRASKMGQNLNMQLGFSHPVDFKVPDTVQFSVDAKQTLISLSCPDKDLLGLTCAKIRSLRPPEPYKGKGIRYLGEQILRKAGKAAGAVGGAAPAGGKK